MTTPGWRRRRWWAAAPTPELPPIGTRRAYAEVLGVFAAFFATGIVAAVLLLADRANDLTPNGSWALYLTQVVDIAAQMGLAVAVVLLLAARRGVGRRDLGLRLPRLPDGRPAVSRSIRIAGWAMFALVVGGLLNAALQTGHLPDRKPLAPELIFGVADALQAGLVEELVVLAFVVVTLRQARRPLWEISVVVLVLRCSYHIYYGPGVVGILLWAALFYWVYLRFGELAPLIVCHALWDIVGFLSQRWTGVFWAGALLVFVLWATCLVLWLTSEERAASGVPAVYGAAGLPGGRGPASCPLPPGAPGYPGHPGYPRHGDGWTGGTGPQPWGGHVVPGGVPAGAATREPPEPARRPRSVPPVPGPTGPPPGWHPDPGGENRWRWWDGNAWTEHVSTHRTG